MSEPRDIWAPLGLPGLVDVHTHFMPDNVLAKVWAYFDAVGPMTGRAWPIEYRVDEDARLALLRGFGVRAYPSLVYAHRPGMARWLTEWSLDWAQRHPDALRTATVFPEPEVLEWLDPAAIDVVKIHLQVGAFDPRDPLLDEVWGVLADAAIPIVAHVASGPTPGPYTGPGPWGEVQARHPRLRTIVAHMGMPEIEEFVDLAVRFEAVMLDTTMAWVDFWEVPHAVPAAVKDLGLAGKILFGSDFPNIPYPYVHQLEALQRLDLGDDWMREVLHDAGARVFGLPG
jgi:predicted TIM-barrel fold metal-dependent hydrolase